MRLPCMCPRHPCLRRAGLCGRMFKARRDVRVDGPARGAHVSASQARTCKRQSGTRLRWRWAIPAHAGPCFRACRSARIATACVRACARTLSSKHQEPALTQSVHTAPSMISNHSPTDTCRRCRSGAAMAPSTLDSAADRPIMPAAGSACPDAALCAAKASGCGSAPPRQTSAASAALSSIGSPRAVPVPCSCSAANCMCGQR